MNGTTVDNSKIIAEAMRLAARGYPVFPCAPNAKHPITPNGLLDATTDEDQILEWFTTNPNANLAMRTDGLLVLDEDPIDGKPNPWQPLKAGETFGACPVARTPRGGKHRFYRATGGKGWRNTAGKVAEGVDTRADGGYVLLYPSVVNGKPYLWEDGCTLDCRPDELPHVPNSILRALNALDESKARSSSVLATGEDRPQLIQEGGRNQTLTSLAGTWRRFGATSADIAAALHVANQTRCNPPLPDSEVDRIAASVGRYQPDPVESQLADGIQFEDPFPTESEEITEPDAKNPGPIPASLIQVDGLLGDIVEFIERGAHYSQPEFAVAAALAMAGTLMGRKVEGNFNTRTNVYLVGLGPSGCGKDRARKGSISILEHAGMMEFMPCEDIASATGLIDAVAGSPAMLLMQDEIHKMLATTKDAGRNPNMFEVVAVLLKLFSSSSSTYLGKAYAGRKKDTRINQPCLSLYGTGIPEGVWQSLTVDQLSDGFLSRLLIIESSNTNPQRNRNQDCSPPSQELIDQVQWWGKHVPPKNPMNPIYAVPRLVADGPGVTELFQDGDDYFRSLRKNGQTAEGIWTRATEKSRKLALIHQLSRDRESEFVLADSAQWALNLVEHVTKQTLYHANIWVSDSKVGSDKLAILRTIRELGGATLTAIGRRHRGLMSKYRDDLLKDLINERSIRIRPHPSTGKRPPLTYEAI